MAYRSTRTVGCSLRVTRVAAYAFWSLDDNADIARLPMSHGDQVLDAALSADGRTLATLGRDQSLQIWDEAESAGASVPLDGGGVLAVAADPSGEHLVVTMASGGEQC